MSGQCHFHPDEYIALMESELPDYYRLQDETAAATGSGASRLLELGAATGETALRVLRRHPRAALVGVDVSDGGWTPPSSGGRGTWRSSSGELRLGRGAARPAARQRLSG